MRVHTIIGAEAAYACIRTASVSLDIRLEPGHSAAQSLRAWAAEKRAKAEWLLDRADMAEAAADQLDENAAITRIESRQAAADYLDLEATSGRRCSSRKA
jgi:hypothetical protein